jgi:hypothetical protein
VCCYNFISVIFKISQNTYDLFFGGWPALPIDRLVRDETATFANMDIQCYIDVAKYPISWAFFSNVSFRLLSPWLPFLTLVAMVDSKLMRFTG